MYNNPKAIWFNSFFSDLAFVSKLIYFWRIRHSRIGVTTKFTVITFCGTVGERNYHENIKMPRMIGNVGNLYQLNSTVYRNLNVSG